MFFNIFICIFVKKIPMDEIWKDIKNYEGLYQVSNFGNVRSLGNGLSNNSKNKLLKVFNRRKYVGVQLCKNSIKKKYMVHRLVYEAFVGEIPDGMQVNHINEDKTDNRLENLNLMTPKENTNWGTGIERCHIKNNNRSKPVLQYDLEGNFIKEWPSVMEIERTLNYANSNISACCLNKYKQAYGYIWKYKMAG